MEQEETVVIDFSDFKADNSLPKDKPNYANPVEEYTLEGVYLNSYKTPAIAGKALHITTSAICECCRGNSLQLPKYGKIFLYKGDSIEKRLKDIEQYNANNYKVSRREVEVYSINGKFLHYYPSLAAASQKEHISVPYIRDCCTAKKLFLREKVFLYPGSNIRARLQLIKQQQELEEAIEKEILKH